MRYDSEKAEEFRKGEAVLCMHNPLCQNQATTEEQGVPICQFCQKAKLRIKNFVERRAA